MTRLLARTPTAIIRALERAGFCSTLTRPPVSRNNLVRNEVNLNEDQIHEDTSAVRGQNEAEPAHR